MYTMKSYSYVHIVQRSYRTANPIIYFRVSFLSPIHLQVIICERKIRLCLILEGHDH